MNKSVYKCSNGRLTEHAYLVLHVVQPQTTKEKVSGSPQFQVTYEDHLAAGVSRAGINVAAADHHHHHHQLAVTTTTP